MIDSKLEYQFLKNKKHIPENCVAIFLSEQEKCEKKDIKDLSIYELKTICAEIMQDLRGDWSCYYEDRITDLLIYLKELIEKDNINSDKYTPYIETCVGELRGETYPDGRVFRDTIRGEGLYDYEGELTLQSLYHLGNIIDYNKLSDAVLFFTQKLTRDNIEEISNVAKILKEKFDVEWIGVFTHHCECVSTQNVDKIITTNATKLLESPETEYLKVIVKENK